ncbi:hypothetical protein AD998_21315, partial [bacterium 336/3]
MKKVHGYFSLLLLMILAFSFEAKSQIVGNTQVCSGGQGEVYNFTSGILGTNYQWSVTPAAAATGTQITVDPSDRRRALIVWNTAVGSGSVTATIRIRIGTGITNVAILNPITGPGSAPTVQGDNVINGPTNPCVGGIVEYSFAGTIQAWELLNWSSTSNGITNSIVLQNVDIIQRKATFLINDSQGGSVIVRKTNSCGQSSQIVKAISPINIPTISNVEGPSVVCINTQATYNVNNIANTSYQWTVPSGVSIVSGAGTNQITVQVNNFTTGQIKVRASNACGQSAEIVKNVSVKAPLTSAMNLPLNLGTTYLGVKSCTPQTTCPELTLRNLRLNILFDFLARSNTYDWGKQSISASVKLKITPYTSQGALPSLTTTLQINNSNTSQLFTQPYNITVYDLDYFQVEIVEITNGSVASQDVRLQVSYEEDRIYNPTVANITLTPLTVNNTNFEQIFQWQSTCYRFPLYELEIVKDPNVSPNWKNALRIQLDGKKFFDQQNGDNNIYKYRLVLAEGTGNYHWRIRAIGNVDPNGEIANPVNLGMWSTSQSFYYIQPQGNYNWIYSRVFSEGSRLAETMSFANGLLQTQQQQNRLQSNNRIIGSQTYQDYLGRNVLSTLPMPMYNKSLFGYESSWLKNNSNQNYSVSDFDEDLKLKDPSILIQSGGDYYGGVDLGDGSNKGVASAEGYPYSRTLLGPDGRPIEQSGVGKTHRLSSTNDGGKTVRTYYSSVADAELQRVFGKEAPPAKNARKIITIDQNGVASVQYQTKDGKTIATALSASTQSPTLDAIGSSSPQTITETITEKVLINGFNSVSSKLITFEQPENSFNYSYKMTPKALNQICGTLQICKTCGYNIVIELKSVTNPTGFPPRILVNEKINPAAACQGLSSLINLTSVVVNEIPAGTYTIEKRVISNVSYDVNGNLQNAPIQDALESLKNHYNSYLKDNNNPSPIWQQIMIYLNAKDLQGLYNYLDTTIGLIEVGQSYQVPIGCDNTLISIPKLNLSQICNQTPCSKLDVSEAASEYITYLNLELGNLGLSLNQIVDTHNQGDIQSMLVSLLNNNPTPPQGAYICSNVWNAWQQQVGRLAWIKEQAALENKAMLVWMKENNQEFLPAFFNSIKRITTNGEIYGTDKIGCTVAPQTLNKNEFYKIFHVTSTSIDAFVRCVKIYNSSTNNLTVQADFQLLLPEVRNNVYHCYIANQNAVINGVPVTYQEIIAQTEATCMAACDLRREELISKIRAYVIANSLSIDDCEINEMADNWVAQCKQNCDINYTVNGDGSITVNNQTAVTAWYEKLMLHNLDVNVPNIGASCPTDTQNPWITISGQNSVTSGILWNGRTRPTGTSVEGSSKKILFNKEKTFVYSLSGQFLSKHATNLANEPVSATQSPNAIINLYDHFNIDTHGYYFIDFTIDTNNDIYIIASYMEGNTGKFKLRVKKYSSNLVTVGQDYSLEYDSTNPQTNPYNNQFRAQGIAHDKISNNIFILFKNFINGNETEPQTEIHELPSNNLSGGAPWKTFVAPEIANSHGELSLHIDDSEYRTIYIAAKNNKILGINKDTKVIIWNNIEIADVQDFKVNKGKAYVLNTKIVNSLQESYVTTYSNTGFLMNTVNLKGLTSNIAVGKTKVYAISNLSGTSAFFQTLSLDGIDQGFATMTNLVPGTLHDFIAEEKDNINDSKIYILGDNSNSGSNGVDEYYNAKYTMPRCGSRNLCYRWLEPPTVINPPGDLGSYDPEPVDCNSANTEWVYGNINNQLQDWINSQLSTAETNMNTQCNVANLEEEFKISYSIGYYHYTLYYYDRSGNLIRTVPPAGVDIITPSPTGTPNHRMVTYYYYNSLGKLISQNTPDGGETKFWYNAISQITHSQNAKQVLTSDYSHTDYDELGRTTEVYEAKLNKTTDKKHITKTVYSNSYSDGLYLNGSTQRYLRNRVSYSFTDADGNLNSLEDQVTTYYSYDPHGNVEWMGQKQDFLGKSFVKYNYDLISGKVLKVIYNEGKPDQFMHRYDYDDENRIVKAETSRDGYLWDTDAAYSYYLHGPLKRTELGNNKVQGLDYTYTIHGWIKAMNHPTLDATKDPSNDGNGLVGIYKTAKDAYGMSLGYYQGDYKNATSSNVPSSLDASQVFNVQPLMNGSTARNLYNGNISTWVQRSRVNSSINSAAIGSTSYLGDMTADAFSYDLLNRITSSKMNIFNDQTSSWSVTTDYSTNYSYDGNGNLLKLSRRANGNILMDTLTYNYNLVGGKIVNNKLKSVDDAVNTASIATDIEDQTTENNYVYDAIGNLVSDAQEGSAVTWNPYGKVQKVVKNSTTIEYIYDASGNRVRKKVTNDNTVLSKTTYYVRDAQGNHLSTYEKEDTSPINYTFNLTERMLYGSDRLGMDKTVVDIKNQNEGPSTPINYIPPGAEWITSVETRTTYVGNSYWLKQDQGQLELLPNFDVDVNNAPNGFFIDFATEDQMSVSSGVVATSKIGQKQYELKDHLGNVRVVVTDVKLFTSIGANNTPQGFEAEINHISHYYPFGMEQPNRQYTNSEA